MLPTGLECGKSALWLGGSWGDLACSVDAENRDAARKAFRTPAQFTHDSGETVHGAKAVANFRPSDGTFREYALDHRGGVKSEGFDGARIGVIGLAIASRELAGLRRRRGRL